MAVELNVRSLSNFASTAESTITTLLSNPTVDLVRSLLEGIAGRIQEHEQLKTQKLRLEIELETSVRSSESKVKVLRNSVEKALAESSKLRAELQSSGEHTPLRVHTFPLCSRPSRKRANQARIRNRTNKNFGYQ